MGGMAKRVFVFQGRVEHAVHSVLKLGTGRGRRGLMVDPVVHGVLRQGKEQKPGPKQPEGRHAGQEVARDSVVQAEGSRKEENGKGRGKMRVLEALQDGAFK